MSKELYVLMDNRRMGRVRQGDNGKLTLSTTNNGATPKPVIPCL